MKLAYVTGYDARDVKYWSGTGYYIGQSLQGQSLNLDYIGPLRDTLAAKVVRKYKRHYYELQRKRYLRDPEPFILKQQAQQVAQHLSRVEPDIVFSATTNSIAYLDCKQPIVFWADATFANVLDFYPHYSNLCNETIQNGHRMEVKAIENCQLAIYSSDWAAQSAIDFYHADPSKVKVVPFGANIQVSRTLNEVKDLIESRPSQVCKLLFLGMNWLRKGGNVALEVAKQLNQSGLPTELTIVGCQPQVEEPLPSFVKSLGFISKSTIGGKQRINQLIAESHFLILPSLADCTPIVFSEANALGVPCLSTTVGGIPTIIKDHINGKLFEPEAIADYCHYVSDLFLQYSDYEKLALSAFSEYQSRLNWSAAGQKVHHLLAEL